MEGLGSLLFFAILFFIMMRFGCGAHMMHGHGGHSRGTGKAVKYIDPVCDMEVEAEQGYGKMHGGKLYRFCSRSCLDKFDADPERYLNKEQGEKHEM
ncbi:MAG: YHS domain-containing protein [Gammaproteobacteria bacterium]|nr:YHS domain-containing protein [Gammaproteobacteria bacterium]